MVVPTEEHQDLLQLLYMAPVGLIKTDLQGDILLANAVAAQLLMPLSRDGEMANLFTLLVGVDPALLSLVAGFTPLCGSICEARLVRVNVNPGDPLHSRTLSLTVTKINDGILVASLSDVSIERQMALKIADSEARMRALLDAAMDAIISMDAEGHITDWNRRAQDMFGWPRDEVLGKKLLDVISTSPSHTDQEKSLDGFLMHGQTEIRSRQVELTAIRRSGLEFPAELALTAFESSGVQHLTAFVADITDRKRADATVHQLAYHDPLTGLANRTLLHDRLSQAMLAGARSKCFSALMILDLDNFKPINDQHGHHVGDLLLVEVARRLKNCVREVDTVARLGGDEFVVLLGSLDENLSGSSKKTLTVAEKIRTSLSSPYHFDASQACEMAPMPQHHCSASIGIVMFAGLEASQTDILKWADAAMYESKNAGRNVVRFFGLT